ncbi:MAG: toprim domain-containing protein, partial [Candidatus Jettenia sp.]|nr:toprim domain-containing protein [Candidatus Jettenia sp.]
MKLIHNQLLKNEAALKTFQDKYGLTKETIEKYLIGYQNEHYVIPIEIEPDKWTLKEHKGPQSKGAKASLYPSCIIKEDLPFIIITEGEFKALLLNQLGFPAVTGTGGANTWKREWNTFLVNLDVVLAYDNDEPGRQGATKVVKSLKG